jgi:hypothetical protein
MENIDMDDEEDEGPEDCSP